MSGGRPDLADLGKRMDSALEVLRKELQGLRTGRASASLLEPIVVEAYGSEMPLTQVGTVNVPEPRMLTVQVWDRGLVKAVEKAIRNSSLGLNPSVDGQLLRVPLPELTQDRRNELVKVAPFAQYPGGDHIIFVAEVRQMRFQEGEPLVFCAGGYRQLTEKETRA